MNTDLCNVCGSSKNKLIDGFYYCVECGTQNENVRETMVEQNTLSDGTFAISHKKRIIVVPKKKIEMSGEWYKWHAYNFILFGLAEQLVAIGAKPTFKTKLLWIWTRYIKKFQNKSELGKVHESEETENQTLFMDEQDNEESSEDEPVEKETETKKRKRLAIIEGTIKDINIVTKGLLLTMIYLALNLDKSHIQLSHLYRFVRENRLNMRRLRMFLPDDIKVKNIPNWINFITSDVFPPHWTRAVGWSILQQLGLGSPVLPDLRAVADNLIAELCLPQDIKPLVHSLMHFRSCVFLDIDTRKPTKLAHIDRIPDYECAIMSYIVVALKMCFGLDGIYEGKISDIIEKTNEEKGYPKSYKVSKYSNSTDRLFSFREWCSHLQFRKIMLCKHCLYMAEQHSLDNDDYVNMEHMEERVQGRKKLPDEITMDILQRIPSDDNIGVIPKADFVATCNPMTVYTDIIRDHCQDPEVKLLLSEDFSQYSLKYVCEDLKLMDPGTSENVMTGVDEDKKLILKGKIARENYKFDYKKVYVKNCESKHWMNMNRPTLEHVADVEISDVKSKDSDCGYASEYSVNDKDTTIVSDDERRSDVHHLVRDVSNYADESQKPIVTSAITNDGDTSETSTQNLNNSLDQNTDIEESDVKRKIIREEKEDQNIFDDSFEYLDDVKGDEDQQNDDVDVIIEPPAPIQNNEPEEQFPDSDSDISCTSFTIFNPATFNREAIIKELVLAACKKYKCPIPKEYKERPEIVFPNTRTVRQPGDNSRTRKNPNPEAAKQQINGLIDFYNNHVQGGLLDKLQTDVNAAIRNAALNTISEPSTANTDQAQNILNETNNSINVQEPSQVVPPVTDQTVENSNNVHQEQITEEIETKLFEDDEMKLDDLMPKSEPKFDEKHHDVEQLYLKINKIDIDEVVEKIKEDPELADIINKQVKKDVRSLRLPSIKKLKRQRSDSEDELPLNKVKQRLDNYKKSVEEEEHFELLIKNRTPDTFKYWCRHYMGYKDMDQADKFDELLEDNLCFKFVLKECAMVLDCSLYHLYRHVQRVEEFMMAQL